MTQSGKKKGLLFVISAPSGTGKTTIATELRKTVEGVKQSISYTTRRKRKNEKEGVDYHFVSDDEFQEKIRTHQFIEWAKVHNNFYGTPIKETEEMLHEGNDILLTIDVQGACQLKKKIQAEVYVFVLPPSLEVLRERLVNRGANTQEEIEERIQEAENEIAKIQEFDYIVINSVLATAVMQVVSIITAERCKQIQQSIIQKLDASSNWNLDNL